MPCLFLEITLFLTCADPGSSCLLLYVFINKNGIAPYICTASDHHRHYIFYSLFPSQISALAHSGPLSSFCTKDLRFSSYNHCSGHRHPLLPSVLYLVLFRKSSRHLFPHSSPLLLIAHKSSQLTFAMTSPKTGPGDKAEVKVSQHASRERRDNQ